MRENNNISTPYTPHIKCKWYCLSVIFLFSIKIWQKDSINVCKPLPPIYMYLYILLTTYKNFTYHFLVSYNLIYERIFVKLWLRVRTAGTFAIIKIWCHQHFTSPMAQQKLNIRITSVICQGILKNVDIQRKHIYPLYL